MALRDALTNERLKSLFKNNFELANYAIKLARQEIKSGQEVIVDDLLDDIRRNPTGFLLDEEEEEEEDQE